MRLFVLAAAVAAASVSARAQEVDPLTAEVELDDARRFADLFRDTGGAPSAAQIEERYLSQGGDAIAVFTPYRIVDAATLAQRIAKHPEHYRDAIERCLPWAEGTTPELRATYLAFKGLLPERKLPRIAVVFGGDNSGGTAAPGMQVLGLEVLCRLAPDEASFRDTMHAFFAHETVHTLQDISGSARDEDPMLAAALSEGTADYVAALLTGRIPDAARDAWARERRDWVMAEFARDRAAIDDPALTDDDREQRYHRWFANAGDAPEGWPGELGYWVGMEIARAYVEQAPDRRAAIRELLAFASPRKIVLASGLAGDVAPDLQAP